MKKKESSYDVLLDRLSNKKAQAGQAPRNPFAATKRTWQRQHLRLILSLAILLLITLGVFGLAWQSGLLYIPSTSQGLKAVVIDGLSLNYPDPSFTSNVTKTLSASGYKVDYEGPDKFTVENFANLPTEGYGLVIIRAHTAGPSIITTEPYSSSKYVLDQIAGSISPATFGNSAKYFAVTAQYVSRGFHGRFPNAIIVLMGCGDPADRVILSSAFADRGASYLIGFDNSVTAQYMDFETSILITALAHGYSVRESVDMASGQDPEYHGQFGFVDPSTIWQQRVANFLLELSTFVTFGLILVLGPLLLFLVPRLLTRR